MPTDTFPRVVTDRALHTQKTKISITLNKQKVGTLQFGLKRYRTTDLFVTRIKKKLSQKLTKSVFCSLLPKKIFFLNLPAINANLAIFST